ncbi:MAG: Crp/Fnr family transcriptional regulator [Clostridium sp.]|uniref:Crp/Fnr family transcriptional regulator n=1 Tax=Clostridium sp. TaxID=1506 RepID=UPI002FCB67EC
MSQIDNINILKSCILFKNFNEDILKSLLENSYSSIRNYSKEETIFFQMDTCDNLSIVLNGTIEIQQNNENGNVLVVTSLVKGNMFGENLLFGDKNVYPMDVVSKDNSTVLHINKTLVTSLLQTNQDFLVAFLKLLSNKAMLLSKKLRQVTSKSLKSMICEFLLNEYKKQKSAKIELNMTKQALADTFGVQRPSLSRELMKMKSENIIDFDRKTITIVDFDEIKTY